MTSQRYRVIIGEDINRWPEFRAGGKENAMTDQRHSRREENSRRQRKRQREEVNCVLRFRTDGQEYAQVTEMMGGGIFECACMDGSTRIGQICGRMNKRTWITVGDIVLVSLRNYEQAGASILLKYTVDEACELKECGELPESTEINAAAVDIAMASDFDTRIDFTSFI